jgi:hypothetical protein
VKETLLVDVDVEIEKQTANAILVTDGYQKVWLPKSQIHNPDPAELIIGESYVLDIPEWLAIERGLV